MPRIWPLCTFIVTKAPGRPKEASALSPAAWTSGSIVSFRLSPGVGGSETSCPPGVGWPSALTWILVSPGSPAQVAVVAVLDPAFADLVAGLQVPVGGFLQLFFVDLADAADHVRGPGSVRVGADEDPLHGDAGEIPLVLFQVVDEVVADVLAQRHRRPRRCFFGFADRPPHLAQRHVRRACRAGPAQPAVRPGPRAVSGCSAAAPGWCGCRPGRCPRGRGCRRAGRSLCTRGCGCSWPRPGTRSRRAPAGPRGGRRARRRGRRRCRRGRRCAAPGGARGGRWSARTRSPPTLPAPSGAAGAAPSAPRPGPGAGPASNPGRSASRGRRRRSP